MINTLLLTGCAGFIGMHATLTLLNKGCKIIGIDNLNDYYDPKLKEARLSLLKQHPNFTFIKADLSDRSAIKLISNYEEIDYIIHLAAQPGVRYSLQNPHAYVDANVIGHLNIFEAARNLPNLKHLIYASSSSVYGHNQTLPFSVKDNCSKPASLYAATKIAGEAISYTYSSLYKIPATGLRFFTVYGPYGRPDMAIYLFTKAIWEGKPIKLFNNGKMKRDFTYIDDIVNGIVSLIEMSPKTDENGTMHKVYNLGNHKSEELISFVRAIEENVGKKAIIEFDEMQKGDIEQTYADIEESTHDFGFIPKTNIEDGVKKFVDWFKEYHQNN